MNHPKNSITVLGAGSWGSALALLLARNGHPVLLWGKNSQALQKMQQARTNDRYLPGILFPTSVVPCLDLEKAVSGASEILIVVPSHAFRGLLLQIRPFLCPTARIVWGTKGLDAQQGQFLHQVVAEVFGMDREAAVLSGPSFAHEVANQQPTAVTLASTSSSLTQAWAGYLHSMVFRVYPTTDLIGVQLAGVIKNILAIASGIAEGLGFGANTKAALVTRGLAEMTRLGLHLGGEQATFLGLAGVGDLMLTCYSEQSRNRRFGLAIGSGLSIQDAKKAIGQVVEGAQNTQPIHQLALEQKVEMPICEQIYQVLHHGKSPKEAVETLLTRAPNWNS